MAKTDGKTFKEFWNEEWPAYINDGIEMEVYVEDEEISVNGVPIDNDFNNDEILDSDIIGIKDGIVYGVAPPEREPSVESYFKKWLKKKNTSKILIECDKKNEDSVKKELKNIKGIKIL